MPLNRKNRVTSIKKNKNYLKSKVKFIQLPDLVASTIPMNTSIIFASEIKNNTRNGCTCRKCGNFNEYAEPNQDDGTFLCFTCKNGY
jgi:hypothetical protein